MILQVINVERPPEAEDGRPGVGFGLVFFRGHNGKYWHVTEDGVAAEADSPEGFYLELREPTRLCIKTAAGMYVNSEKNGGLKVGSGDQELATRWEF